jgi:fucose permease
MFSYQGAEVAISGWVISFLIQFRHRDSSKVGYVTSGFWAGITLGSYSSQTHKLPLTYMFLVLRMLHALIPSPLHGRAPLRLYRHRWST